MSGKTPGQRAYEAYRAAVADVLLPPWDELTGAEHRAWEAAATAATEELAGELDAVRDERDDVYRERARLVAFLAACYPSEIVPAESDSGAWFLVFVTTPDGQMSWHLHEDDLDLFEPLLNAPETGIEWDGHTTDEKYRRLASLVRTLTYTGPPAQVDASAAERERDTFSEQLAAIRERLALLAANLEASAAASAPSRKSEIEQGIADKVRAVLSRDEAIPDAPAIVTAGAEHIAAELLDPGNPGAWQRVADMTAEGR